MTRIKTLQPHHCEWVWRINEEGLPGVGKVSQSEVQTLIKMAHLPLGCFIDGILIGFCLCLLPGTPYGSRNYRWFNQRHDSFLYVDRIAVRTDHRNSGVGGALYERVFNEADAHGWSVAAEVNTEPPNPGSMRFHMHHGFERIGTLDHGSTSVAMLLKQRT